jgi:hypothetical protein
LFSGKRTVQREDYGLTPLVLRVKIVCERTDLVPWKRYRIGREVANGMIKIDIVPHDWIKA